MSKEKMTEELTDMMQSAAPKVTVGQLKKMIDQMKLSDDAVVKFLYRENIGSNNGRDLEFDISHIWGMGNEEGKMFGLLLVGVTEPEA